MPGEICGASHNPGKEGNPAFHILSILKNVFQIPKFHARTPLDPHPKICTQLRIAILMQVEPLDSRCIFPIHSRYLLVRIDNMAGTKRVMIMLEVFCSDRITQR
jgi:hypothetical protein